MIRFIHTADVHYGMENYGRIDQATGIHSRLLDFHKSFNICIDYAIEHAVDFFLFSGDAYKTTMPSPTQQKLFLKSLLRLQQAGIPVVLIIGNHDNPLSFGKAHTLDLFSELPLAGFHVISKPSIVSLNTKNGPVNVVGIPWPTRNTISISSKYGALNAIEITDHISQAVARIIAELAGRLDKSIPTVLGAHLTVSSGIFSGSEKRAIYGTDPILLPSQLAIEPFDYVGLGHLHRYQNLNENGYPAVVYSGSIDRVDFGERKEEKGFCDVMIQSKGKTSHQFIQVPTRPFLQIEIELTEAKDHTDQIIHHLNKYDIQDAVIKIIYHLPPDTKDSVNVSLVQKACSAAWYIVGIIPIRALSAKQRRAQLSVDMDLETVLDRYFDSKADLKVHKERLVQKALALAQEVASESEENV